MRASDTEFQFPVFGFEPGTLGWQFANRDEMTECREVVLERMWPDSLELVDSLGNRWAVISVHRLARVGGLVSWWLGRWLGASRCRIDYDLESRPPVTLPQVKEMACAAMAAFREDDDYSDERKAETAELLEKIRQAAKIADLAPVLNWPSFASF